MSTALAPMPLQPLMRLAQNNTQLMTEFWTSPEVMSQLAAGATQWAQQAQQTTLRLMTTPAFANLGQGLLQNTLAFMAECSESAVALARQRQQAQAADVQATAEATVLEPTPPRRGAR